MRDSCLTQSLTISKSLRRRKILTLRFCQPSAQLSWKKNTSECLFTWTNSTSLKALNWQSSCVINTTKAYLQIGSERSLAKKVTRRKWWRPPTRSRSTRRTTHLKSRCACKWKVKLNKTHKSRARKTYRDSPWTETKCYPLQKRFQKPRSHPALTLQLQSPSNPR